MSNESNLERYLASYVGIDGGNPKGGIWICGIEYGGEFDPPGEKLVPQEKPGAWDQEFREKHPKYSVWQYHQKVAKLMVGLRQLEQNANSDPSLDAWRQYMDEELYSRGGEAFKLNLFPFSSPSVQAEGWKEAHSGLSGLGSKEQYYDLCRRARFDFLADRRREFRPQIILGTGKTYRDDFAKAFGFNDKYVQKPLSAGKAERVCYIYRDEDSVLVVSPFFGGRFGINSDGLIRELSKLIDSEIQTPA